MTEAGWRQAFLDKAVDVPMTYLEPDNPAGYVLRGDGVRYSPEKWRARKWAKNAKRRWPVKQPAKRPHKTTDLTLNQRQRLYKRRMEHVANLVTEAERRRANREYTYRMGNGMRPWWADADAHPEKYLQAMAFRELLVAVKILTGHR